MATRSTGSPKSSPASAPPTPATEANTQAKSSSNCWNCGGNSTGWGCWSCRSIVVSPDHQARVIQLTASGLRAAYSSADDSDAVDSQDVLDGIDAVVNPGAVDSQNAPGSIKAEDNLGATTCSSEALEALASLWGTAERGGASREATADRTAAAATFRVEKSADRNAAAVAATCLEETASAAAYIEALPRPQDFTEKVEARERADGGCISRNKKPDPVSSQSLTDGAQSFPSLKVEVKKADQAQGPPGAYRMSSRPRGRVLLINNEHYSVPPYLGQGICGPERQASVPEFQMASMGLWRCRTGSHVDEEALVPLFTQLGFEVEVHNDKERRELERTVHEFTATGKHKNADMTVVIILSHGLEHGKIVCTDRKEINVEDIYRRFNNEFCPELQNKPKLFIVQACRGNIPDFGVLQVDAIEAAPSTTPHSILQSLTHGKYSNVDVSFSDMLVVNATVPGYVAMRHIHLGTWFIQTICVVFMEHAATTHLLNLMNIVAEELRKLSSREGHKESCTCELRTFTRELYFNPGL